MADMKKRIRYVPLKIPKLAYKEILFNYRLSLFH